MTAQGKVSRFFKNAAASWIAFLFIAVVSFFLSPYVVRHLGGTAYGVWSLLVSIVGYLGLLDFGVRGTVNRYVAHHHAVGDDEGCSSIVSAGLVLYGIFGVLAILVSTCVAYFSATLFNIPESFVKDAQIVLVLGGLTVATTLISAVFAGVVTGLERFDISSVVEISVTALRTVAVIMALEAGLGLVALGFIHLAASVLTGLATYAIVRRVYPELRLTFRQELLKRIRTILSFSMFLSLIHAFGLVIYYSNALILAIFLPIAAVTFFAIAGNLIDYAGQVAQSLAKLMVPRISALTSLGSKDVGEEILSAARIATLATAPIAATFWVRGESFVNLWMGTEYGPTSGEILRILALVVLLRGARAVATASIIGANMHRTLIPALGIEAICNVALSVALVGPLGIPGVAFGMLVPTVLVTGGYIPRCLSRATGVSAAQFVRQAWIMPTIATIPFALISVLFESYFRANNLAEFFLQVISLLFLVPVFAWVLCVTPIEKRQIGVRIKKLIG